jgi:hypothetical protein
MRLVVLIAAFLLLAPPALAASAASDPAAQTSVKNPAKKHVAKRVSKGVGFLPGYRTPEQIERDRKKEIQRERRAYYRAGGPRIAYWRYPQPQFYRGRWNGGDFGPCWTHTPIGYQWNCGR